MARKRRKKITWTKVILVSVGKALIFPFKVLWLGCKYCYKGLRILFKKGKQASVKAAVEAKRPKSMPKYEDMSVKEVIDGKFEDFEKKLSLLLYE